MKGHKKKLKVVSFRGVKQIKTSRNLLFRGKRENYDKSNAFNKTT